MNTTSYTITHNAKLDYWVATIYINDKEMKRYTSKYEQYAKIMAECYIDGFNQSSCVVVV